MGVALFAEETNLMVRPHQPPAEAEDSKRDSLRGTTVFVVILDIQDIQ